MSYAELDEEEIQKKAKNEEEYLLFKLLRTLIDAVNKNGAETCTKLDQILTAISGKDVKAPVEPAKPATKVPETKVEKPVTAPAPVQSTPAQTSKALENAKAAFTQECVDMLLFTEEGNFIKIAPRRFLGSDNFAKIASVVREIGGEYVSAGRNSHFKVQK